MPMRELVLALSWIHEIPAYAGEWLPLLFFVCMVAIVYLLWRTLQMMPRVNPTHVQPGSRSSVRLADLAAARIRKLFAEARKNAPSIIFVDELDAVGAARTGHGFNREQDQTLNQLLVELDGFLPSDQVVVMGASNRLQDLDPALLRPGRFDRQMLVGPPDLAGREAILHVHTRGKPLAADVDVALIARQTSGLTGADLANIANEAAIFAGRESKQYIHHVHFDA